MVHTKLKYIGMVIGILSLSIGGISWLGTQKEEATRELHRYRDSASHVIDSLETENDSLKNIYNIVEKYADSYGTSTRLSHKVYRAAKDHDIPVRLAFNLIHVESRWLPRVVSHKGAIGLGQVLLPTARTYDSTITRDDLKDPALNLHLSFQYLRDLYDRYGDWRLALMAYHRGPGRVDYELSTGRSHGTSHAYAERILE